MGWLSKAWSGVKKTVKKVAKGIKKVAKKVVTSIPGGSKLWKEAGRLGTKVLEGVSKVTNALGPVGMIALSVLAPYAAPLWSSFGAAVGAGGSLAGGVMGTIGNAIYTAGNWVAGTIGSMTQGISKAIGTIAEGGFKGLSTSLGKAGSEAVKGFADAFTGTAGSKGVASGVTAARDFALKEAAGQSLLDQTVNKITGDVAGSGATEVAQSKANAIVEEGLKPFDPNGSNFNYTPQHSPVADPITQQIAAGKTSASAAQVAAAQTTVDATLQSSGGSLATNLAVGSSLTSKATDVAKSLLSGGNTQPRLQPIGDVGGRAFGGNTQSSGGVGSGGGNFLSQAMVAAMQQQTQRMTRGFG